MSVRNDRSDIEGPAWSYTHRGYALLQSFRRLGRSRLATMMTLAVLGTTMTLPALFLFSSDDAQRVPIDTHRGKSMTLYLDLAVNDLDGAAIADNIEQRAIVADTEYISRAEALATFQTHAEIDDALELLNGNPLPGAIVVYPDEGSQSPEAIKALSSQLSELAGINRIQLDLQWVERLEAVVSLARFSVLLLGSLLTLTALIVIGNTIRLEMSRQSREMEVTRLLGATRRFTSRPFVYLGALFGFLGSIIAILAAVGIQLAVGSSVRRLADAYGSQFALSLPTPAHLAVIIGIGVLLGIVGAVLALFWQLQGRSIDD